MLPAAVERIARTVADDALVLDVGGGAAPFNRADHVLDLTPFAARGSAGSHGLPWERFTARTWLQRDACDRAPWPWPDDHFAFAVCTQTLQELRDPVWVSRELSRVARAGYVEVTTVAGELVHDADGGGPWLGRDEHRWLCAFTGGELVFTHKPHAIHHDQALRVTPRWRERMAPEDHVQGFFWEAELRARERFLLTAEERAAFRDELRAHLRARFAPSTAEVAARQASDLARQGVRLAARPARQAAARVFDGLTRRRE